MFRSMSAYAMVLGFTLTLSACNSMGPSGSPMSAPGKSLYERLGGKTAITAVVDDFVGRVAADNRINGKFANANIPRLKSSWSIRFAKPRADLAPTPVET